MKIKVKSPYKLKAGIKLKQKNEGYKTNGYNKVASKTTKKA